MSDNGVFKDLKIPTIKWYHKIGLIFVKETTSMIVEKGLFNSITYKRMFGKNYILDIYTERFKLTGDTKDALSSYK